MDQVVCNGISIIFKHLFNYLHGSKYVAVNLWMGRGLESMTWTMDQRGNEQFCNRCSQFHIKSFVKSSLTGSLLIIGVVVYTTCVP